MSNDRHLEAAKQQKTNVLDSLQVFVDSNIRVIQNTLYVIGGVGLVIAARSIYMTTVFTSIQEIPEAFISKQVKLRGKVIQVCDNGLLKIEHIPIMRLRVPFKAEKKGNLQVHLACIDVSPQGKLWLEANCSHKVVWFQLLHRNIAKSHLYSKLEIPRLLRRNIRVNEELIQKGLASISSLNSLEQTGKMTSNQNILLYLDRLVKLEQKAAEKGVGMWTETTEKTFGRKTWEVLKIVLSSPYRLGKWIYRKRRGKR